MERSNLFNHLLRIFDEGLSMKTTELEYGTLEVTVENRSQDKKITFLAKGMEDAKQKAAEWQVGQMLLNCDDYLYNISDSFFHISDSEGETWDNFDIVEREVK